jgi:MFS family permease
MFKRLAQSIPNYPHQFWLLFWGMLISTTGSSMIWPFLNLYVSERLGRPWEEVAILFTLNAAVGITASFVAGPVADRIGRKIVMVISLLTNALAYLVMSQADSFALFAVLFAMTGASNPLYRVGADAMLADLLRPEQRSDGYSLLRMSSNLGIAIGPLTGGLLSAIDYRLAFYVAAVAMTIYGLMLAFMASETLIRTVISPSRPEILGGYSHVLGDRSFIALFLIYSFGWVTAGLVWMVLPAYASQHYALTKAQYSWLPTTNAIMVVTLQVLITRMGRRHHPLRVMALGMTLYAISNLMIALGRGFWGFWASMVVLSLGELILVPTATTHVANLAPNDMRGRYMSIFGLSWNLSTGIGPLIGSLLSQSLGQFAPWYGGLVIGLLSALLLLTLARFQPAPSLILSPKSEITPR